MHLLHFVRVLRPHSDEFLLELFTNKNNQLKISQKIRKDIISKQEVLSFKDTKPMQLQFRVN